MKKFARGALALLLLLTIAGFAYKSIASSQHKRADLFKISNIALRHASHFANTPLSSELDAILDKEFTYLARGKQYYVFCSEDGKYVLKFFKCQRLETPHWLKTLSFLPFLKSYYTRQSSKIGKRRKELFASCELAFEELQEETGLIYIHLNKTSNLQKKVRIIDKLLHHYALDIDKYEFIIQRRADLILPTLQILKEEGNFEGAKKRIDELLALLVQRHEKGIIDFDPAIINNTGFLDDRAIHLDLGRFAKCPEIRCRENSKSEIDKITKELRESISLFYPALSLYFEEKLLSL